MATSRPKVRRGNGLDVLVAVSVIAVALATSAHAAEAEKEAVRNRVFTTDGRFEVGLTGGLTVLNTMTQHYNGNIDIAYNFTDAWALMLGGGYALGSHTSVAHDVFREVGSKDPVPPCPSNPPPNCVGGSGALTSAADFHNLWTMGPHAELNIRWSPIYGKLNLAGELPVHFQAYVTVGGGAGMFNFISPVFCLQRAMIPDPNDGNNPDVFYEDSPPNSIAKAVNDPANTGAKIQGCVEPLHMTDIKPIGNFGGGLRIFITKNFAIKLEFRDYLFPDQLFVAINRAAIGGGATQQEQTQYQPDPNAANINNTNPTTVNNYCKQSGNCQQSGSPGITNLVMFNGGIQWLF